MLILFRKWMTDQMKYQFANKIHENDWSLELRTILRTPYCDLILEVDDWPDGVSICWWDSRKQLESRIENNSPYSTWWPCYEKVWLARWSTDRLMRSTVPIGVSIWKQFSVLHIMTLFWRWMTDQMYYWSAKNVSPKQMESRFYSILFIFHHRKFGVHMKILVTYIEYTLM